MSFTFCWTHSSGKANNTVVSLGISVPAGICSKRYLDGLNLDVLLCAFRLSAVAISLTFFPQ